MVTCVLNLGVGLTASIGHCVSIRARAVTVPLRGGTGEAAPRVVSSPGPLSSRQTLRLFLCPGRGSTAGEGSGARVL